jgi:hypothetical protein
MRNLLVPVRCGCVTLCKDPEIVILMRLQPSKDLCISRIR